MTVSLLARSTYRWARCAGVSLILVTLAHPAPAQETSFAPVVHYPASDEPAEVAVCDFNGDEFPDIVVRISPFSVGTGLGVLINDGAGCFGDIELIPGVTLVGSITCCDIDGDGDNDVVTAGTATTNFIALNDGTGLFTVVPGPVTTRSAALTDGVICCDFDSDGDLDIVIATGFEGTPQQLELFRNNGNGRFGPGRTIEVANQLTDLVSGVACVDLDGNGHNDIVGYADSSRSSFTVLFNDGLGGLSQTSISRLARTQDVAFGELDGAPGLDAVVVHRDRNTAFLGRLRMFQNTGNGMLSEWIDFDHTIAHGPRAVCIGRISADSLDDVIFAEPLDASAHLLVQVPDGFEHIDSFPVGGFRDSISCIDLNNDGFDDLVAPGGSADVIHVLINTTGLTAP